MRGFPAHTHTHTHIHTHTYTHTHSHTHTHTYTHTHTHTHTHSLTQAHTHTQSQSHKRTHTRNDNHTPCHYELLKLLLLSSSSSAPFKSSCSQNLSLISSQTMQIFSITFAFVWFNIIIRQPHLTPSTSRSSRTQLKSRRSCDLSILQPAASLQHPIFSRCCRQSLWRRGGGMVSSCKIWTGIQFINIQILKTNTKL